MTTPRHRIEEYKPGTPHTIDFDPRDTPEPGWYVVDCSGTYGPHGPHADELAAELALEDIEKEEDLEEEAYFDSRCGE